MPKRVDANQAELVAEVRRLGGEVQHLHTLGHGCPDLLIAFADRWLVVEVKDGEKPPSRRRLTPDEERWHARFPATVLIWESVEDVQRTLQGIETKYSEEACDSH